MTRRPAPARLVGLLAAPLLLACNQTTIEVQLHSLQASSEVAFVCRQSNGKGIDRSQCPDYEGIGTKIFALVTQTSTEEVAVIDTQDATVVDLEPATPGYAFLRVPSRPGDIVSTPGGAATFVALTGVGKTGITAIATTCLSAPKEGETARDVTSFPSCHLPTMPGDLAVLIAPPEADDTIRVSCDPSSAQESDQSRPPGATRPECAADLTREHLRDQDGPDEPDNTVGTRGRRKLAVALPDFGEIVIIDGQWLLDQTPGSFPECRIEARLALDVELGTTPPAQQLPPELEPAPGCVVEEPVAPPPPPSFTPRPGGFGVAGDFLYVADRAAPVVHRLDVSNPCAPSELPPLLPVSFEQPNRIVTTSRVAASPLTPDGKRFVYAIDEFDRPASLMAFDVSPGSTDRTPLVRPGALLVPEPPDRLRLGVPVADVAFALRDLETTDPETGVAESGVKCDPNPAIDPRSAAAQHRPTSDETQGAQPRLLRGLFGLAMLTSGHVAIIDVDDFDAPCRRPRSRNELDDQDFRGCASDARLPDNSARYGDPWFFTLDGTEAGSLTVTDEVSCNMVEPHRFRSAGLGKTSSSDGTGAPSLVAFPEFTNDSESLDLPPQNEPKLLAVPFVPASPDQVPPEPQAYIGTTLHKKSDPSAELPTDPNTALLASLTLPFTEPRAFPPGENVGLVYEGPITGQFPSGRIVLDPSDPDDEGLRIEDGAAEFCDRGVYDLDMLGELGRELGVQDTAEARELFARAHADVVEVTNRLLPVTDTYWNSKRMRLTEDEEGGYCGLTYSNCVDTFGTEYDVHDVNPNRELVITEAYQDQLLVEPRNTSFDDDPSVLTKRLQCCFPQGLEYRVHLQKTWVLVGSASGLRSDVTARKVMLPNREEHFRCERDCDPRKTYWNGRVFEIASSVDCLAVPAPATCAVGLAEPGDPCVYNPCSEDASNTAPSFCDRDGSLRLKGPLAPGMPSQPGDASAISCIHSGITSRFALYRGLSPSIRGMTFSWQTSGGFRALLSSLASVSIAVLPQHVEYVPELQRIAIVDGAQLGLTLVSLDTLRVEDPWPVY